MKYSSESVPVDTLLSTTKSTSYALNSQVLGLLNRQNIFSSLLQCDFFLNFGLFCYRTQRKPSKINMQKRVRIHCFIDELCKRKSNSNSLRPLQNTLPHVCIARKKTHTHSKLNDENHVAVDPFFSAT